MRLTSLLVRFYKSFNYDYELKAAGNDVKPPWQVVDGAWLPHIRVDLEPDVTAVVGANESGKSHLLDAVEVLLGGQEHHQRDFCRYSPLFSVERELRRYPEFGGHFQPDEAEAAALRGSGLPLRHDGTLLLLRPAPSQLQVVAADGRAITLEEPARLAVQRLLPVAKRLRTDIPVPDSVMIRGLTTRTPEMPDRARRNLILDGWAEVNTELEASTAGVALHQKLTEHGRTSGRSEREEEIYRAGQVLGRQLLLQVARVDPSTFDELEKAIREEREGLVNGLIQKMNESLARHLNLSRWWTQDAEFHLRVSPREHELVFTIRDRTGTDYGFGERSTGLRYFLSYFVQLRAHQREQARAEVLLMDEPDTYLSATGQQDLLRTLEHHARPDGRPSQAQVAYVTHSPFLINRNAGHRVRVLDKGSGEEGTRVVADATRNRYEPLRSALGTYVAETAFIGNANLFVEGTSDQVLVVGMTTRLRHRDLPHSQLLDLNTVTVVSSGSADSVPYSLYMARGRDEVKPPCVALLDSDRAGKDALATIRRGGANRRPLLADDFIVMLGTWGQSAPLQLAAGVTLTETEDLLPMPVAVAAARGYAVHLVGRTEREAAALTEKAVTAGLAKYHGSLFDAVEAAFEETFDTGLAKIGFAKEVVRYLEDLPPGRRPEGVPALDHNFTLLIAHLSQVLRNATAAESGTRRDRRVVRAVEAFVADHPDGSTRDRANMVLHEIEAAADDTRIGDRLRATVATIRRQHRLGAEPMASVADFDTLRAQMLDLRYNERLAYQEDARARPPTN